MLEPRFKNMIRSFKILTLLVVSQLFASEPLHSYGVKLGITQATQDWNYEENSNLIVFDESLEVVTAGIFVEWFNRSKTEFHGISRG